jgi:non-ribosomal peptide synthetase component F
MRSAQLEFDLGEAKPLRNRAAQHGATMFMALATAWSAVLTQASGLTDIVLLTPVPGRAKPGSEALVGCLVQSMLLLVNTTGDPGFEDLLQLVRTAALDGLDHQFHPFATFYKRHPGASFLRVENWAGMAHLPGLVSEQFDLPRALDAEWPTPDGEPDRQAPELAVVEQPDGRLKAWLLWNDYAFDRSTMESIAGMLTDYVGKEMR